MKEKIKEKVLLKMEMLGYLGKKIDKEVAIELTSKQYEKKIKELQFQIKGEEWFMKKFKEAIPKQKIKDIIKEWEKDVKSNYITKVERTLIIEHIEELEALLQAKIHNFTVKDEEVVL